MSETTSDRVARLASQGLRDPISLTLSEIRAICASALNQAPPRKSILKRILGK